MHSIVKFEVTPKGTRKNLSIRGIDRDIVYGLNDHGIAFQYDLRKVTLRTTQCKVGKHKGVYLPMDTKRIEEEIERELDSMRAEYKMKLTRARDFERLGNFPYYWNKERDFWEQSLRKQKLPKPQQAPFAPETWNEWLQILITDACSASELTQRLKAEGLTFNGKIIHLHGGGWQFQQNERNIPVENFLLNLKQKDD